VVILFLDLGSLYNNHIPNIIFPLSQLAGKADVSRIEKLEHQLDSMANEQGMWRSKQVARVAYLAVIIIGCPNQELL
jgi:hypothetical protein